MRRMSQFEFGLQAWSAWSPQLTTFHEWLRWASSGLPLAEGSESPKASFLPASLRRRCSKVSRAALEVTRACLQSGVPLARSIFGSRHGEAETTLSLLKGLARQELLSPTEFGLSVHNTTAGLFSIAFSEKSPACALAGGPNTVNAVMFEALMALEECSDDTGVLVVIADEPLPIVLRDSVDQRSPFFALSLLLRRRPANIRLNINPKDGKHDTCGACYEKQIESLIRWLVVPENSLQLEDDARMITLSCDGPGGYFSSLFFPIDEESKIA
jgi:hypothetical protein